VIAYLRVVVRCGSNKKRLNQSFNQSTTRDKQYSILLIEFTTMTARRAASDGDNIDRLWRCSSG